MITRREIIASALAVSVLPRTSAAGITGVAPTSAQAARPFITDARFPQARVAARAAELRGAAVRWLTDDVTSLYQSLDRSFRSAPFALAGLTTKNALFVIERLAWERGLRTVLRGIHRHAADGGFHHELAGCPALLRRIDVRPTADWASMLGSALAEWAPHLLEPRHIVQAQTVPGADGATLASWLLVPKDQIGQPPA